MKRYILTIDEGTTSVRAVLYDVKRRKFKKFSRAFTNLIEPQPSWVEQDANDIWEKTVSCLKDVTRNIDLDQVYGLGITNQRETIVAWDKKTGLPLTNAIIWKCRRTSDYCNKIKKTKIAKTILYKTGLIVNSYFSATKMQWMLKNIPAVIKAKKQNRLCFGTIESYLVYRLTNKKAFVTDITNASRTMLFNIRTLKWDDELLKYFNIPKTLLPQPVDNDKIVGTTEILGRPIFVAGLIGDQQSSLLGQGCFHKGDIKNTYGTGCFMLANIGDTPVISKHKLLTTIAFSFRNNLSYALEGNVFSGGSAINEIIKQGLAPDHRKLTRLAMKCKGTDLYFVPAFNGLGAPYWKMDAKPHYVNLNAGTLPEEKAYAVWSSIALRSYDIYESIIQDIDVTAKTLCVDGGLSKNKYLMRLQSSLINKPITIINLESTCMGAIICTGLATKAFQSLEDVKFHPMKMFYPLKSQEKIQSMIDGWKKVMEQYK